MKAKLCYWVAALTVSPGAAAWVQAPSTIQFTAASYEFAESAGFATITVQRLSDPSTTVSVDYATADGTATNGLKYTAVSGTLSPPKNRNSITRPLRGSISLSLVKASSSASKSSRIGGAVT